MRAKPYERIAQLGQAAGWSVRYSSFAIVLRRYVDGDRYESLVVHLGPARTVTGVLHRVDGETETVFGPKVPGKTEWVLSFLRRTRRDK